MKKINFKNLFLVSILVLSTSACTKSSKEMVDEQQDLVNNTPLPSDEGSDPSTDKNPNPSSKPDAMSNSQVQPLATAISCKLTILSSLAPISQNGEYNPQFELGTAEHCVGETATGTPRPSVEDLVQFNGSELVAQVHMSLVPKNLENGQNHSAYRVQFYLAGNIPVGAEHEHQLNNLSTPAPSAWKQIIRKGKDKYLLICKARSSCDQ